MTFCTFSQALLKYVQLVSKLFGCNSLQGNVTLFIPLNFNSKLPNCIQHFLIKICFYNISEENNLFIFKSICSLILVTDTDFNTLATKLLCS